MSSHVIADLEAVCDWLVLLNRGKVQLAGAIEEILAGHRLLTGPRTDTDPSLPGVIRAAHSNRHTDLLVRTEADRPDVQPAWQSHPVLTWFSPLPGLIGAIVGASLLGREYEHGTWRLAWTQAVPGPGG
jgi:hypothetical protein